MRKEFIGIAMILVGAKGILSILFNTMIEFDSIFLMKTSSFALLAASIMFIIMGAIVINDEENVYYW